MKYRAARGRLTGMAVGAVACTAGFLFLPGFSGIMRTLGVVFGLWLGAFAVPFYWTARIVVTEKALTLRRFGSENSIATAEADVYWQRMPVGYTKIGWTVTVLPKDRSRRGWRLPLFGFDEATTDDLRKQLTRVTGQQPKTPPLVRRRRTV